MSKPWLGWRLNSHLPWTVMKRLRTIKASEIGVFLFCQRAWWYQRQGIESRNQAELETGSVQHWAHNRRVVSASLLQRLALALLVITLLLLSVYLAQTWI